MTRMPALLLALFAAACATTAETGAPPRDADLAARLDAYLEPLAAQSEFSGVVRVERDGEVMAERRYGYADWTSRADHRSGTLYAGASITKGVLAVLLLDLAEAGALDLDAPVHALLPVLPERPDVTVRTVLRHRAGLPRDLPTSADLAGGVAAWLAGNPEAFGPAGEEAYSNVGYALLAEVAEAAGGASFAELAADRVLRPAGMMDSLVSNDPVSALPGGARPYTAGPPPLGVAAPVPARVEPGASGLAVTVADLAAWGEALSDRRGTALFAGDDPLGSLNAGEGPVGAYVGAQGTLPGYAAGVTAWPDTGVTVAYVANLFSAPVLDLDATLRRIVAGEDVAPPPTRPADRPLSAAHAALAGDYDHPAFGPVTIARDASGQGMRITMPEREPYWTFYLTPVEGGRLHWRAFDTVFEPGEGGGLAATAKARTAPERLVLPPRKR